MAEAAQLASLARELRQFQFLNELYQHLMQTVGGAAAHNRIAVEKTFGRWLQNVQHFNPPESNSPYHLLPRQLANDNSGSRTELTRMLHEDLHLDMEEAAAVTVELFDMVREFLDDPAEALPDVAAAFIQNGEGGQISVGGFSTRNHYRVSFLANRFGVDAAALVCLRYAHLSKFLGGESGMSVTGLNALHDVGLATFEGFASPLNCRLLGREGVGFCSLFEDTDAAFGSLGNFFRIRLADHPGGWILSPPFVESVLDATADRVVQTLDETEPGRFWFFVTFPHWPDNKGWQDLDQSPRKVARIDFEKEQFLQQGPYGEIYRPVIRICIFVLGQLPDEVDLVELRNRISVDDEATVEADWREACGVEQS